MHCNLNFYIYFIVIVFVTLPRNILSVAPSWKKFQLILVCPSRDQLWPRKKNGTGKFHGYTIFSKRIKQLGNVVFQKWMCPPSFPFLCGNNSCLADELVCNGHKDCPEGNDEDPILCDVTIVIIIQCLSSGSNPRVRFYTV